MNKMHAHRAEPRPPTRIVVSGGPKADPFLVMEKPRVSNGVRIWTCCIVTAAVLIVLAVLFIVGFFG